MEKEVKECLDRILLATCKIAKDIEIISQYIKTFEANEAIGEMRGGLNQLEVGVFKTRREFEK